MNWSVLKLITINGHCIPFNRYAMKGPFNTRQEAMASKLEILVATQVAPRIAPNREFYELIRLVGTDSLIKWQAALAIRATPMLDEKTPEQLLLQEITGELKHRCCMSSLNYFNQTD